MRSIPGSRLARSLAAAGLSCALAGCNNVEKADPQPQLSSAKSGFDINANQIMRGTVASEAVVVGIDPVVVRGYGLVVGLNGTGSREMDPRVRNMMIEEMSRRGVGSGRTGWGELKPEELLNSLDTAVVIVEGVIPPASVGRLSLERRNTPAAARPSNPIGFRGTLFDIRVSADPRSGTTSLEGGLLYTTELRPGPLSAASKQAFALAEAYGPIYLNPFADASRGAESINQLSGRILNGGEVLEDMILKLRLARPSHSRAAAMVTAINSRFVQEPGQRNPTARGESDDSIEISVPTSYRNHTIEFIELLRHTSLFNQGQEVMATSVKRAVETNPALWESAAWRWEALGKKVTPVIRDLYDTADERPRRAALRAGAKLNDALVVPHVIDMARGASQDARLEAIDLLGQMGIYPQIDMSLRELLNDPDVEVRLAAYEASVDRRDPLLSRVAVADKFVLDVIRSDYPMIYITQRRQPRIAVFGPDTAIDRPITANAWANRLMIKEYGADELEVYYRRPEAREGIVERVSANLPEFIQYLGHDASPSAPKPGLGLSYGEVVGAVYSIWKQNYIAADFKTERDRILQAIMDREKVTAVRDRPLFESDGTDNPDEDLFVAPPVSDLDSVGGATQGDLDALGVSGGKP